jgi:hypothetical protein
VAVFTVTLRVANAPSQRGKNWSKLKDKVYKAGQVVVMPSSNFRTLEVKGTECCLPGQPGPHTQNMSFIQQQKWHRTQTKPAFHNGIEKK